MAVKVAINGFGRIGRLAFRQMFGAEGYEIVAINDLTDAKMLAHLLKYDSSQGRYALGDKVEAKENSIVVDGKEITIYAEKDAKDIPWAKLDVDVVLECSGFYASKEKATAHFAAGARKVVISAPAGNDLPTIVYSVNEKTLKPTTRSFPRPPARRTAWLRWRPRSISSLPSRRALCPLFTLIPAIRCFLTVRTERAT